MSNESLFLAVFVYLLAAVVSVALFKRLGLSSVLGYLVAGIVIGPFGLGFVGEEGQDVMHFAEFGVVMMLFLVGLELQPPLLWRMRGPILGLGGGQVVATTLVIAGLAALAGLSWQMALAVGMSLALSSTAIVLQSLQEKGQTNSTGGRSAFAVLLFQDIAVIPMLAIMPLLATASPDAESGHGGGHHGTANPIQDWLSHQASWVNTLAVLAAVALIVLCGRYLLRPVLRVVAKTGVREAFVALTIVIVVGIALLMNSIGVSAALGTFLAGVVLADSEYRHELEADLEPFKGLLLGVFFIAVGASIDFELVLAEPLLVAGIVVGLMVVKALLLFGLGSAAKLILDQRLLFSLSLAQGSEFAFVLLGFALGAGVLEEGLAQLLIASVALTMALTPLVMILEEKVLRKAFGTKQAGEREADAMAEDAPVILAGVGRFGNYIARLLKAQRIPVTVIDSDPDHVEVLRRIGIRTFYGDVCRHDLLEAAGAAKARLLVIAIDNREQVAGLLEAVRKHFPNLQVLARALSRQHLYELLEAEVSEAVHQHAGSAIELGERTLRRLGYRGHQAARIARRFRKFDEDAARKTAHGREYKEEETYLRYARERMAELEEQFSADDKRFGSADTGWDSSRLRADTADGDYGDIAAGKEP